MCVCACSIVAILGAVLRNLLAMYQMYAYVDAWECVSICECVCIVFACVYARGWGCVHARVCMRVYV